MMQMMQATLFTVMGTGFSALDLVGWVGAALVLWAFWANSNGKMLAHEPVYQWLNFFGGGMLAAVTLTNKVWSASLVNSVWAIVALFALVKIFRDRAKSADETVRNTQTRS